jgi:hypothetical protein
MWIHSKKIDIGFILIPHVLGLLLLLLFPSYFLHSETSTWDWLILILLIDVAHVYSTLFRTYFVPEARKKNGKLLILIPVLAYCLGVLAMEVSFDFFWRILAYLAVFHFIRQQYGLLKLYQVKIQNPNWLKKLDTWLIYLFTIIPILIWHVEGPKNFSWFTKNDFIFITAPFIAFFLKCILGTLFCVLAVSFIFQFKKNIFNIPKNVILLATALNWSIGIVYLNGDLSFTLLNVVAHGIPYICLVWIYGNKDKTESKVLTWIFTKKGWVPIVLLSASLGFVEEGFWDSLFWQDHPEIFQPFWIFQPVESKWLKVLLVPLLALPQITHYVIDGFIWKKPSEHTFWQ